MDKALVSLRFALIFTDKAVVTRGADEPMVTGGKYQECIECWASISSNVIPIILATFWVISESRFGSTQGIPGSWHPFFDMISESRFVNTHSVVEHTTLGIFIY